MEYRFPFQALRKSHSNEWLFFAWDFWSRRCGVFFRIADAEVGNLKSQRQNAAMASPLHLVGVIVVVCLCLPQGNEAGKGAG
ncbi:hypothetical protein CQZ99_17765 [Pseudomonas poae]|uniref:Uncharacterized protein n=2 Tax=Pseudomonas poae TaxID=200451 RepID=A0A2S9EJ71_9PSED|nr:hypothetical protein CQZ97_21200 [Pseudomonas poae]PRC15359.1 hypothetical protein CQZ99_17765 [Pseudomonas poae]